MSLRLKNLNNILYIGEISLGTAVEGTEDQTFTVVFDTGSSDLWIPAASSCSIDDDNCVNGRGFYPSRSSTFHDLQTPFQISYGDGSHAAGTVAMDVLKIGTGINQIVVPNIYFGLSTIRDDKHGKTDGVFGLGFGTTSTFPGVTESPFESMTKQINIKPQFGFFLNEKGTQDKYAYLYLGGHDENLVLGDFTVVKAQKEYLSYKYWAFALDGVSVGGKMLTYGRGIRTWADSGSTRIVLADRLMKNILDLMPEKERTVLQRRVFPCKDLDLNNLPEIAFVINNVPFVLIPDEYIDETIKFQYEDGIQMPSLDRNIGHCIFTIEGWEKQSIILGDVFMRKYYTRFDFEKKEIGFALAKRQQDINTIVTEGPHKPEHSSDTVGNVIVGSDQPKTGAHVEENLSTKPHHGPVVNTEGNGSAKNTEKSLFSSFISWIMSLRLFQSLFGPA